MSRLDWIYVLLLCMQDGTVATGDMNIIESWEILWKEFVNFA